MFRRAALLLLVGWLTLLCAGRPGAAQAQADEPATFTITAASAFLRAAPSPEAPATYSVFQGEVYVITARTANNTWLRIDYPRAVKGTWILATVGQVAGDLGAVPLLDAGLPEAAATRGPAAAPTSPPPTATPTLAAAGPVEICVLLYTDLNGNGLPGLAEGVIGGGQLLILDAGTGAVLHAYTTQPNETAAHCFTDLSAGAYTVTVIAPPGYNATTATSIQLPAQAGARHELTFGAQPGAGVRPADNAPLGPAVIWGALGLGCLALAAGLIAVLIARRGRPG